MIKVLGSELKILLKTDNKEIQDNFGDLIALGIDRVKKGELEIVPGFDGRYGKINIFKNSEINKQKKLI
jgi:PHP family Zn ribbon phosphoesterase